MPNLGKRAAEDDEGHDDMQEPLAPRRSARLRRSSTISSSTSTSAAASTSSPSSPSTASISTVASLSTARTSPSPDLSMPPPQSTQSLPRKIRLPAHNGRRISIVIAPGSSQSLPWEISGPRPVGVPIPPIPLFQPTGLTDRPPRQKPRHRASFVAPAATEVGPSTPTPSPRPVQEPPRRSLSVRSISPDVKPQHVLLNPYSYFPPEPTTSGVWHVPTHEIPAQCQRTHTSHHENRRVWVEEQKRWICARGFASGLQVMSAMFMCVPPSVALQIIPQ
ncbi:hypothetical protein BC835DRAFT_662263 [Cytidiella melzeri]|nr:hypothetical protein BC835DRAFT_662263 [Cytidiella melzeri]